MVPGAKRQFGFPRCQPWFFPREEKGGRFLDVGQHICRPRIYFFFFLFGVGVCDGGGPINLSWVESNILEWVGRSFGSSVLPPRKKSFSLLKVTKANIWHKCFEYGGFNYDMDGHECRSIDSNIINPIHPQHPPHQRHHPTTPQSSTPWPTP